MPKNTQLQNLILRPLRQLDIITARAVDIATPLYERQAAFWTKEIEQASSYSDIMISPLDNKIRRHFEQVFMVYWLMGKDTAGDEIKFLEEIAFAVWQGVVWSKGFQEALDLFLKKEVISAAEFKAGSSLIKATTFSVQRVESANALYVLNRSIQKAIDSGIVFRDWKLDVLPKLWDSYGITAPPKLTPRHLKVVFITNENSVYHGAKWDSYSENDFVYAIRYITMGDVRVRDKHAALANKIYLKSNPIWNEIYPPNDYSCRCGVQPLTKGYIERNNIELSGKVDAEGLVHEDFKTKPGMVEYQKKMGKVADAREKEATLKGKGKAKIKGN